MSVLPPRCASIHYCLIWPNAAQKLARWGYDVTPEFTSKDLNEVRRFLADWSKKIQARYLMVSLPPDFA